MSYIENRVRVDYYGSLPENSSLLVNISTTPGHKQQRAHILLAQALSKMSDVVDHDLGFRLLVASGWRPHRWKSREQYKQVLIAKYGSVKKGRLYLGFDSPHETGLAIDFSCGGLEPVSATIKKQKQTKLFKWLVDNAWKHGFTPYKVESWHWEYNISLESYRTGKLEETTKDQQVHNVTYTQNDVCEDNLCIEAPWDINSLQIIK